jgi:hypothetical protein
VVSGAPRRWPVAETRGRRREAELEAATPLDAHQWISFADPDEDRTWVFDVTFLLSGWTCIYGHGCQGVLTGPTPEAEQGCCSYGAHFTSEEDVSRVRAVARSLSDSNWQYKSTAARSGPVRTDSQGAKVTRLVEGACIFLNRPGFPGGAGCALHRAALEHQVRPLEYKPDVCWQLPLRREDKTDDHGHVTSVLGQWDRRHWGPGGAEFHWWCTEAADAFVSATPVYRQLAAEIAAMVGSEVAGLLSRYLDAQHRQATSVTKVALLPHPALRGQPR